MFCRRLCYSMDRYVIKIKKPASKEIDAPPVKKLKTDSTVMAQKSTESEVGEASGKTSSASSTTSDRKSGFRLKMVKGDLFKCPSSHSLAHCVSADINMGKGIAKIFKKTFGGVDELKDQGVKTGGVAVLKIEERFIYYLVTKDKYWQKPTYDTLQNSLEAMANHCKQHKVTHVSMPLIGCGLDKLQWSTVSDVIKLVFKETDLTVTVYTLENKKDKKVKKK